MAEKTNVSQVLVLFRKTTDYLGVLHSLRLRQAHSYSLPWGIMVLVEVPSGSEDDWVARFRARDDVESAELPDGVGLA